MVPPYSARAHLGGRRRRAIRLGLRAAESDPLLLRPHAADRRPSSAHRSGSIARLHAARAAHQALYRHHSSTRSPCCSSRRSWSLAASPIVLDSGFPMLYAQERVGLGGKPFKILKFRLDAAGRRARGAAPSGRRQRPAQDAHRRRSCGASASTSCRSSSTCCAATCRWSARAPSARSSSTSSAPRCRATTSGISLRPGITGWSHVHMKRNVDTSAAGERLDTTCNTSRTGRRYLDVAVLFQTLCEFLVSPGRMNGHVRVLHILADRSRIRRGAAGRRAPDAPSDGRSRRRAADDLRAAGRHCGDALPFPVFHAGAQKPQGPLFPLEFDPRDPALPAGHRPHAHARRQILGAHCRAHAPAAAASCIPSTIRAIFAARRSSGPRTGCCIARPSRVVTFFKRTRPAPEPLRAACRCARCVVIPNGLALAAPVENRAARSRSGWASRLDEFAILRRRAAWSIRRITSWRCAPSQLSTGRLAQKAVLLFAGAGENEVMLRGLAAALGNRRSRRFLGYRTDLPALLARRRPRADDVVVRRHAPGAARGDDRRRADRHARRGLARARCSATDASVFSPPISSRFTSPRRSNARSRTRRCAGAIAERAAATRPRELRRRSHGRRPSPTSTCSSAELRRERAAAAPHRRHVALSVRKPGIVPERRARGARALFRRVVVVPVRPPAVARAASVCPTASSSRLAARQPASCCAARLRRWPRGPDAPHERCARRRSPRAIPGAPRTSP